VINVTLGQKIKNAMKAKGINQVQLAAMTGLSQPTISDLVNDVTRRPAFETIDVIAQALRKPPLYFRPDPAQDAPQSEVAV
jgi:transcriptional regulator with XRE-family HTH domain